MSSPKETLSETLARVSAQNDVVRQAARTASGDAATQVDTDRQGRGVTIDDSADPGQQTPAG